MKKVFFTAALAMTTLFASAQFMVITTVQEASDEADGFEMEQVTNNIGLGYMLNDKITVGVQRTGEDENGDTTYDMWARYSFGDNMWAVVKAPSEEASVTKGLKPFATSSPSSKPSPSVSGLVNFVLCI